MVTLDGQSLTIEQVVAVARDGAKVSLEPEAAARVQRARALVEHHARGDAAVYGVNTGFGALKNIRIDTNNLAELQLNLIRSHAVGVGDPLPQDQVRALMVLRANCLANGRSGIRLEILELMLAMLNQGIHPVIPEKGSVGASGDLAPLAHFALVIIGEGEAEYQGKIMPGGEALAAAGLEPAVPEAKEGLALVNGTQAMTAIGCLMLHDAENLTEDADIAGAASLEGRRGTASAFDPRIHAARPYPGQIQAATHLASLVQGSEIASSHEDCDAVQDPYSFRCMPQVHGSVRDVLAFVRGTFEIEINSGTDNPLVFAEDGDGGVLLSGGNFHGQPVAFALDFLAIGISELASISERRVEQLVDPALSGLPAFLVEASGLNSGFMMAQVTAASLVSENRMFVTPSSCDSVPTSANQEDHVSMGMTSARKVREVVLNTRRCLAIELLCACQAIDLIGLEPGTAIRRVKAELRQVVPKLEQDRVLYPDIDAATELLASGRIRDRARG